MGKELTRGSATLGGSSMSAMIAGMSTSAFLSPRCQRESPGRRVASPKYAPHPDAFAEYRRSSTSNKAAVSLNRMCREGTGRFSVG